MDQLLPWRAPGLGTLCYPGLLILCKGFCSAGFVPCLLNGAEISLPTERLSILSTQCHRASSDTRFEKHPARESDSFFSGACQISISHVIVLAKAVAVCDLMALNHLPFIHPSHSFANLLTIEYPSVSV